MKRTLLFIACVLTSITMMAQDETNEYLPFVEIGKQWHVVNNPTNPFAPCSYERFEMNDEVERDGKTYVLTYRTVDEQGTSEEVGLFREEGRRVYKYVAGREVMLYDFSLKEGDTFIYEYGVLGEPTNCKVLKQGWLEDGPNIQMLDSLTPEGAWTFKYRKLRTWTIGVDNGSGGYNEAMTWIECIGTLKNTFVRPYTTGVMSCLAYILRKERYGDNEYLPFPLYNMYGPVYGSNLPKGAADSSEDWHEQFTYTLEGDRLHVSGKTFLNCGGYYYAYFTEESTDDPKVRKLHLKIEEIGDLTTCASLYGIDFYVSGFDPAFNYIVVDNLGEEYPVINKSYRPFVEEGKVWKVGDVTSGNPLQMVDYYYFDGDTIIDGKTCKQMMRQRYITPEHPDYVFYSQYPMLVNKGAWYEEDKKVYTYDMTNKQFEIMYDFSLDVNDTLQINSTSLPFVVGPRQTGGIKGFKGYYHRNVSLGGTVGSATWLEGVGTLNGPEFHVSDVFVYSTEFLLSCAVGDEVIYFNDEYEDGATPAGARKSRFDFSHTTKTKPKTRMRSEEDQPLYGEYNEQQLSINLSPINDAYQVYITNESGNAVYERIINTGSIVGLNIDISAYTKGHYTVTVENSQESFTGEFETLTNGIEATRINKEGVRTGIYNLQGQRLNSLQKGLNIVDGKKVYVK
jgi:hypothetical protein